MSLSKTMPFSIGRTTSIVLGAAGLAFLGYCVYFDRKRRSDPLYKEKIRQRRLKSRQGGMRSKAGGRSPPDLTDPAAIQAYFLQEIQMGEEKLALGMTEEGITHLTNAIAICGQPHQLLQVLQQTLPPEIFQQLITRLPQVAMRGASSAKPATVVEEVEDDLE